VTENPVRLTHSVRDALARVTCGGAPVYIWPGGGITFMVDVSRMPQNAFGYVPTPALVAPIEFTLKLADYAALGGHMSAVRPLSSIVAGQDGRQRVVAGSAAARTENEFARANSIAADGRRLHLQDGPIDLIVEAFGPQGEIENAYRAACARFERVLDELCAELCTPATAVLPGK
jgi:hypothetical protein